jgi:3-hydroxyacyl-CoA dehydrogenase/enoyl-CoA hydratase/3-hydroxybutyryl-CoA epimerase
MEGYYGKKNKKGFYIYKGKKRTGPDAAVYSKLSSGSGNKITFGPEEIVERSVLLMVKEAALCLEEKIIERPDLLDAALIFGIGFPPFRGGLLRYADKMGAQAIVEKLDGYAKKYGERFTPPRLLIDMAKNGQRFYSQGRI